MKTLDDLLDACRIEPDEQFRLADHDPTWAGDPGIPRDERKALAKRFLDDGVERLVDTQDRLYASDSWAVLVIFQAMDAAGKDSTIKHVMSGLNPQGTQVFSFKKPSAEDLDHDFLWRYNRCLPERGRIGIFNRSYYEEVLVVRVHPEILAAQRIPDQKPGPKVWRRRYREVNAFERHLTRSGTRVVKFFLNISRDEQRQRFLGRLNDPVKHWKFNAADLEERALWDDYMKAFERAIRATSTRHAPWHVIPADHKWVARALVASILARELERLDLRYPEIDASARAAIDKARHTLETEGRTVTGDAN